MKSCDIVVPVHNRTLTLAKAIDALGNQDVPEGWSVRLVIIDDGSTEDVAAVTSEHDTFSRRAPWLSTLVLRQPHSGQAVARNEAIRVSRADIILLLGADILLRPGALALHLKFHDQNPQEHIGALGMVKWDPALKPTPFMEWMTHGGQQNNFDDVLGVRQVDPRHYTYASHISCKRAMISKHPFSSMYTSYGWEDLDVGRRLAQDGFALHVLHDAIGLHHHFYSTQDILERQQVVGGSYDMYRAQHHLEKVTPGLTRLRLVKMRAFFYSGLEALFTMLILRSGHIYSTPRLFLLITAARFWQGVWKRAASQKG